MDKKELKFYESPAAELVEMDLEVSLLAGSGKAGDDVDPDNDDPIDI